MPVVSIKALATQAEELGSIPETHMGGKNQLEANCSLITIHSPDK